MKKLIVFSAGLGLGLALIAGSFETSQAQEKSPVFQKTTLFKDSLKVQTLQEKVNNNSAYLKPGSLKPGKVAGEFLLGGFGAVACGVGAVSMIPDQGGWAGPGVVVAGISLYVICSNLGCASGVYLIGMSGGETGSYLSTLGGSWGGTLVGSIIGFPLLVALEDDDKWWSFVAFTAAQSVGATIGFNHSKKGRKTDTYSEALLNINDCKLAVAFPQVGISPDSFNSSQYSVNLFQANF